MNNDPIFLTSDEMQMIQFSEEIIHILFTLIYFINYRVIHKRRSCSFSQLSISLYLDRYNILTKRSSGHVWLQDKIFWLLERWKKHKK